jgi:SAM-dependent methyltransferase
MPSKSRRGAALPVADHDTVAYFDHHVPEYSPGRLQRAVQLINEHKPPKATLIDVGCGVGDVLAHLAEQTGLTRLVGLDVSPRCLALARGKVAAELHQASILDPATVHRFGGRFDVAVVAAVLHHLVGPTRRRSRRAAILAVANALQLVRPGGFLVIMEPTFAPSPPLTALFWAKSVTSKLTSRRLPIGGYWNNVGPPVVSYYSERQLVDMVKRHPAAEVVYVEAVPQRIGRLAGTLLTKTNTTIMAVSGSPPPEARP